MTPPHAAGLIDVTAIDEVRTVTSPGSFKFYAPSYPPDPFVFEPLLFPIAYQGAGAFASMWETKNTLQSAVTFAPLCADCSSAAGHLVYIAREPQPSVVTSFIRDVSRDPNRAGTPVPIGRDRDFREILKFPRIPLPTNGRATLRVWSLDDDVVVNGLGDPLVLRRAAPGEPAFTSVPLSRTFDVPFNLYSAGHRIWALVSITDNATQEVTIYAPQ